VTIFNSGDIVIDEELADAQFQESFETQDGWVAIQSTRLRDIASLAQCLGLVAGKAPDIYSWMRERTAQEVTSRLEHMGIFAARVARSDQLLDSYMRGGGPFCYSTSGKPVRGRPFLRAGDKDRELTDAPVLGQDTRHVLTALLAIPEHEIDRLVGLGIVDVQDNEAGHIQPRA